MFLLRAAFWLSIVILLLPVESNGEAGSKASGPSAMQTIGFAQSVIADMGAICVRSPDICKTGSEVAQSFGNKARYGAHMLYKYLDQAFSDVPAHEKHGTLTAKDFEADWRPPKKG